jgi:hypothetical protein
MGRLIPAGAGPSKSIRGGFERLEMLLRTGSVDARMHSSPYPPQSRPGLAFFSVLGYARLPNKSWRDAAALATAISPSRRFRRNLRRALLRNIFGCSAVS